MYLKHLYIVYGRLSEIKTLLLFNIDYLSKPHNMGHRRPLALVIPVTVIVKKTRFLFLQSDITLHMFDFNHQIS